MSAVVHKALSEPTKFPAFLSASLDAVRADKGLSKGTLTSLAMQMRGMSTDSIAFTTVPLSNSNYMTPLERRPAAVDGAVGPEGRRPAVPGDRGRQADHPAAEADAVRAASASKNAADRRAAARSTYA